MILDLISQVDSPQHSLCWQTDVGSFDESDQPLHSISIDIDIAYVKSKNKPHWFLLKLNGAAKHMRMNLIGFCTSRKHA